MNQRELTSTEIAAKSEVLAVYEAVKFINGLKKQNMWQKCPICDGSGTNMIGIACGTCNGEKIINILTGKPPSKAPTNNNTVTSIPKTFTGDFRDDMCNEGK